MPTLFVLLTLVALVLAVASLLTPKTAFFLKEKTRKKAFFSWLGIAVAAFALFAVFEPGENIRTVDTTPTAPQEQAAPTPASVGPQAQATPAPAAALQAAAPTAVEQTPAPQGKALPYAVVAQNEDVHATTGRNRLNVTIVPTESAASATQQDLAATVMGAAAYFQQESELPVVTVTMICQRAANSYGEPQLAYAVYIPDGKGIGGTENSSQYGQIWNVSAAKRGFMAQELEYLRLWAEMRGAFQKDDMTDEPALRAAIEKRMKIAPGSLEPFLNFPEKFTVK